MTGPNPARRDAVLTDLRARMAEPHRHYHGQAHVDALLADFNARRAALHDPAAVEFAVGRSRVRPRGRYSSRWRTRAGSPT